MNNKRRTSWVLIYVYLSLILGILALGGQGARGHFVYFQLFQALFWGILVLKGTTGGPGHISPFNIILKFEASEILSLKNLFPST